MNRFGDSLTKKRSQQLCVFLSFSSAGFPTCSSARAGRLGSKPNLSRSNQKKRAHVSQNWKVPVLALRKPARFRRKPFGPMQETRFQKPLQILANAWSRRLSQDYRLQVQGSSPRVWLVYHKWRMKTEPTPPCARLPF